jgi:ComF family protein
MHKKKLKARGYNQAEIISVSLSKKLGIQCSNKLLFRVEYTAAMSRLAKEERRMNIENAFAPAKNAAKKIEGKKILLVDDIYTTGSTADACSLALLKAGASEVRFISFAAGANLLKWDKAAAQVCG